jgi:hypothetical protein
LVDRSTGDPALHPVSSASAPTNVDPTRHSIVVRLRDGSSVHIRPVVADDLLRFFGAVDLDWASRWAIDVDAEDRYGLVATADPGETIVGHGSYVREDADRAEMAFVVADAFHELGIATILLRRRWSCPTTTG